MADRFSPLPGSNDQLSLPSERLVDMGDGTYARKVANAALVNGSPVSSTNPLPMQPSYKSWDDLKASTVYDATLFGMAEFDFSSINGHTIAVLRDSSNPPLKSLTGFYDQNGGGPYTTITSNGVYQFIGGGYMMWTVTGGTGTPTCNARSAQ